MLSITPYNYSIFFGGACKVQTGRGFHRTDKARFRSLYKKGIPLYYETNVLSLTCCSLHDIEAEAVMVAVAGKSWQCMNLQAWL